MISWFFSWELMASVPRTPWGSHSLGTLGTGRLSLPCYYPYATKRVAAPPFQVAKVSLWGKLTLGLNLNGKLSRYLKIFHFPHSQ